MQPGYGPYAPPYTQPVPVEGQRPSVVVWAKVYAAAFALMYLGCTIGGVCILVLAPEAKTHDGTPMIINGIALAGVGLPLMVVSIVALFAPRKKWGWIMNLVILGLGCTSCLCLPVAIPLMLYWLKPETKQWFGV